MNAGNANWNWPEVEGVLAALVSDEEVPIVCGGQAVSFCWHRTARQPANRRILNRLELDWKALVPIEQLRERHSADPLVARFLDEQWPRLFHE